MESGGGRSTRGAWRGNGARGLPGAWAHGAGPRARGRVGCFSAAPRRPPPPRLVPPLSAPSGGGAGRGTAAAQTHSQAGGVAPPGGDGAHPEGARRPWDQVGRAVRPRAAGPTGHAGFVAHGLQSLGKTRQSLARVLWGARVPFRRGLFRGKKMGTWLQRGLCPPGPLALSAESWGVGWGGGRKLRIPATQEKAPRWPLVL